jgi:transcription elongation factor GreA
LPTDQVVFGATVVVRDLDLNDEEEFTLVGAGDEDYDAGKYLITSPIGQGLLGKKVGDKVEIPVPRGVLKYEVLAIRFQES